jgi:hypothetical protein
LELIQQLKDKVDNKQKPKKDPKKATEAKPFNLTQPRPRAVPTPEKIPLLKVYKPVSADLLCVHCAVHIGSVCTGICSMCGFILYILCMGT